MASSFAACGVPEAATTRTLQALLANTQTTDAARIARRNTELGKLKDTVRSGYAKFAPKTTVFDPWARYIVPAFPLDILLSIVQDFVGSEAAVIGCDPSAMAMSALGAFSGALHHGMSLKMLRNGNWHASPRMWILLVAPPSWKKTPIFNSVIQPLVHYEAHLRANYQTDLYEYEKAKDAGEQVEEPEQPPRYLTWGTTVEKLGKILTYGDGRKVFSFRPTSFRVGSAAWSVIPAAVPVPSVRSGSKPMTAVRIDRIRRGEIFILNLSVSILGGIQPERLAELHKLTSAGLLQRFVPFLGAAPTFRQDRESDHEVYDKLVRQMIFAKPTRLIMTDESIFSLRRVYAPVRFMVM